MNGEGVAVTPNDVTAQDGSHELLPVVHLREERSVGKRERLRIHKIHIGNAAAEMAAEGYVAPPAESYEAALTTRGLK